MVASLYNFYRSAKWLKFRAVVIAKRANICEDCGKIITEPKDIQVHHVSELTEKNYMLPEIALNEQNVKVLCRDCHNRKHGRFGYESYRNHKVYIVYGPPLSGKNTLVSQLMKAGDMIVDIDMLYQSISGLSLMQKPDNLRFNAFRLRDVAVDMVRTRYGRWYDAYIIGGYPNKIERESTGSELGAELIYCDATKEECYRRLSACEDYRSQEPDKWQKYIDKWFESYTA